MKKTLKFKPEIVTTVEIALLKIANKINIKSAGKKMKHLCKNKKKLLVYV
jgi:hypothetical protein